MMIKTNFVQHEQHLKLLEKTIRAICDEHKMLSNLTHDAWTRTMELFVLTDALRGTRLEFETVCFKSRLFIKTIRGICIFPR